MSNYNSDLYVFSSINWPNHNSAYKENFAYDFTKSLEACDEHFQIEMHPEVGNFISDFIKFKRSEIDFDLIQKHKHWGIE